jgi:hypothetical protein
VELSSYDILISHAIICVAGLKKNMKNFSQDTLLLVLQSSPELYQ